VKVGSTVSEKVLMGLRPKSNVDEDELIKGLIRQAMSTISTVS
jgi:hypothetical protein